MLQLLTVIAAMSAPIALAPHRTLRPDVAAFPHIVSAASAPQRRINRALVRLDARVSEAARACLAQGGQRHTDWQRQIATPMRGPEFVSYVVTDDYDCGGAYPSNHHSAIVYDLRTGAPVDWTTLLPPALTGELGLIEGPDGVRVVTLASARLSALYRAGYDRDPAGSPYELTCRDQAGGEVEIGPVAMLAWLDAEREGFGVQFDLNHARQACSRPVVIPAAVLRREGASPRLLNALKIGHAALDARR